MAYTNKELFCHLSESKEGNSCKRFGLANFFLAGFLNQAKKLFDRDLFLTSDLKLFVLGILNGVSDCCCRICVMNWSKIGILKHEFTIDTAS